MAAKHDALTHARLLELLSYNPDTGIFRWRGRRRGVVGENSIAGCLSSDGHWQLKIDHRLYSGHQVAWFYCHGVWPTSMLDHKNNNRSDNRLSNLRLADATGNAVNRVTKSKTGYRGVFWKPTHKKYEVRIRLSDGRRLHLGHFVDPIYAAKVYDAAARQHHGEFARTNFHA